jgi:hypothetical protein
VCNVCSECRLPLLMCVYPREESSHVRT